MCAAAPFTPIVGTLEVNRDTDTDAEEETDSHAERRRDSGEFLECFGELLGRSCGSWALLGCLSGDFPVFERLGLLLGRFWVFWGGSYRALEMLLGAVLKRLGTIFKRPEDILGCIRTVSGPQTRCIYPRTASKTTHEHSKSSTRHSKNSSRL